jgi:hypothetical protein
MTSTLEKMHSNIGLAKHLISALGWTVACLFSIYILVDRVIADKPYTILHVIAPPLLLLASIIAMRRFLILRSRAANDSAKVPSAGA